MIICLMFMLVFKGVQLFKSSKLSNKSGSTVGQRKARQQNLLTVYIMKKQIMEDTELMCAIWLQSQQLLQSVSLCIGVTYLYQVLKGLDAGLKLA